MLPGREVAVVQLSAVSRDVKLRGGGEQPRHDGVAHVTWHVIPREHEAQQARAGLVEGGLELLHAERQHAGVAARRVEDFGLLPHLAGRVHGVCTACA